MCPRCVFQHINAKRRKAVPGNGAFLKGATLFLDKQADIWYSYSVKDIEGGRRHERVFTGVPGGYEGAGLGAM